MPTIPASWVAAGPTADGVRNFFGDPRLPPSYNVGPGLGTPDSNGDREALLDNVPDVTPLQTAALQGLLGRRACAVVYDSDVSVNMGPTTGSLKGSNLGTVAFEVVSVTPQGGSQLPDVEIKIFDAEIFCTDVTAPTISAAIGPPANGAGWHNTPPTVLFNCQDGESGIDFCTAPVTVSAEGTTTVVGVARDFAGNEATINVTVQLDTTPPAVSAVTAPPPNANGWNNGPVTVTFDCQDAGSGADFCSEPVSVTAQGTSTLFGTATDLAGNANQITVAVQIDSSPPSVSADITTEPNPAGWNNSDATVTFNASDFISGVASVSPPVTVTTEAAGQAVNGSATDFADNSASASATVNLDKTPPVLSVTAPLPDAIVLEPELIVDGTAEESLSGIASVTCAGEEASLSGSNFSCDLTLDAGANSITVGATDVAGNTASETLTVTYATGPQVTITSPADFSLVTAGPVVVSGTVDEEDAIVTVAGVPASVSGGSFNASVPLHSGANTITVVATSQNGSSAIATVHVTLDDSPPLVTIDSPLDGQTVNTSMITVSGMVKDIIGPAVDPGTTIVSVNGVAATITNDRYSASSVALAAGLNTISAFAADSVGNSNSASISVSFVDVTGQPRIEVVSGNGQQGTAGSELSSPLIARVADAGGNGVAGVPVVFQVARNNGTLSDGSNSLRMLTATTGASGEAQVNWTLGTRAGEGANLVEATAAGFQGVARFTATGTPGAELHLHADAGENQSGLVGQPLPQPFAVVVTDAGHNRLGNIPVTYTVI